MAQYCYPPLPSGNNSIRLLRLKPDKDNSADIRCELFEYSLQNGCRDHLYEALSYVWGGPDKKLCIFINSLSFDITGNLYAALSQLRNHTIERIMWVDAICINQENLEEKAQQIQMMARIYGQANRVIVWLGEAVESSDQALDKICITGCEGSLCSPENEAFKKPVLSLLQRQWFRRIWILQEVAAARDVVIVCGSAQIDGYAFCLGVELLMECYNAPSDLRRLILSVTYLIRGAIFRPRGLVWVANKVCPLSELVDMYHAHEATKRHDKVYALLGMSSDIFSDTGLSPDYQVLWKDLLETLIKHVLCKELSVEVLPKEESATIRGECYILGSISGQAVGTSNGRQDMFVAWTRTWGTALTKTNSNSHWDLHPSAKQVRTGDVVCLFQRALKPTIVRFCEDHWIIIIIAATPPQAIRAKDEDVEWPRYLQGVKRLQLRKLQCCWDWNKSPRRSLDREECNVARSSLDHFMEAWMSALLLGDIEEYEKAERKFHEAMSYYEMASREGCIIEFSADLLSFTGSDDLNSMNKRYCQPPLSWAAEKGYKAVVGLLIGSLNANVDFKDKVGRTAILFAATNGYLAVVERLLEEKADVNAAAAKNSGRTALQAAAEGGHLAVVERLLEEKADVNAAAAASNGRTALQAAAEGGHLAVVERLLEEKAEVNAAAAEYSGRTALQAAAEGGHLAVVERLLEEKADVNATADYDGRTALQAAAEGGHLAVVERLLEEKADVNAAAAEYSGRTALQAAAEEGHLAVIERLLEEKADVNAAAATAYNGRSALQAAAEGGHLAVVERLQLFKNQQSSVGQS